MKKRKVVSLVGWTLVLLFVVSALFAQQTWAAESFGTSAQGGDNPETSTSTADHSKFEILQQDFQTGPEVTAACLTCHTEAAHQIMGTTHWKWTYTDPQTGEELGKKNVINSFCGSIKSNEPRCTSCHVGYGWKDDSFDFTEETNVDCLVCHDTTGTYKKIPDGAGAPFADVDLGLVARNIGKTSRQTCGACHFNGGGGNGVKHGDLDQSLISPDHYLDVHMDADGANFTCSTCHTAVAHNISGSRYQLEAKDEDGLTMSGSGQVKTSPTCEDCHGLSPHPPTIAESETLNEHIDTIACQTCHIPSYARGGDATKTWWDWSTAGRLDADGKPFAEEDENGNHSYMSQKGDFVWKENVQPEYYWFNGNIDYQNMKPFDPNTEVLQVNQIHGSANDPNSRIWPFKVMHGKQAYDTVNNTLVVVHVYGKDDTAYWTNFEWEKAIQAGMDYAGHDYSGEYGFIETEMYWPISHMVAPADEALQCNACHTRGNGVLANVEDVYIPGITKTPMIDKFGWGIMLLTFMGVVVHGLARFIGGKMIAAQQKGE